jgi:hypothetical protein
MLERMKTRTGTWEQEIIAVIPQAARVSIPSIGVGTDPAASNGLSGLGGKADPRPLAGSFSFVYVFFGIVRRRQHPEVRIRFSPPYPRSGGASSTGGGRVESCVRRISWNLVGFCDCLCAFRSVSSDLRFSSLAMVVALMRWSFGVLARWLHVCLL